ncbi:uncharacterized protein METZ01_LOCUS392114, partial [marine metagenome]
MICSRCNKNNPESSKFCVYCANKLELDNKENASQLSKLESQTNSSNDINKRIDELDHKIGLILNALSERGIIKQPTDDTRIEVPKETTQEIDADKTPLTADKDVTPTKYKDCKSCGVQNESESKFCIQCGNLLQKQSETFGDIYDAPIDDKPIDSKDLSEKVTAPTESKTSAQQSKSFRLDSI